MSKQENTGGMLNVTATADKSSNDKVSVSLTVSAADVDAAIDGAYKAIAKKYAFQGFRRGRAPRPVIDGIVGKQAVLAQATEDLLNEVQPQLLDDLDIVAIEKPSYAEDAMVEEHKDFVTTCEVSIPPVCELKSYDAPSIKMPPENATDAEIDKQIKLMLSYSVHYEDADENAVVSDASAIVCDVEDKENASMYAGKDRRYDLSAGYMPTTFVEAVSGMKKGETKDISWSVKSDDDEKSFAATITITKIQTKVTPELNDEFAKNSMGYDTVDALREALKSEIEEDKKNSLPALKEDRLVIEAGKQLDLEKVPEVYENQVFQEIANEFLSQLQRQGATLDMFLASRGIQFQDFLNDLHEQAAERARQSLALNAIAAKQNLEATEEDVISEFKRAGREDVEAAIAEFKASGQMPAIRESIRRAKAVKWLVDNAQVEIVDEVALEAEEAAKEEKKEDKSSEKKPSKKTKKASAKKETKDDEKVETSNTEA